MAGMLLEEVLGQPTPPDSMGEPEFTPFSLSAFRESNCAVVRGEVIKRREIIKYFANVRGGAHLQLSSKVRHKEEALVKRVSRLEGAAHILRTDALHYELLSIGQAVAQAPDCETIAQSIRKALT